MVIVKYAVKVNVDHTAFRADSSHSFQSRALLAEGDDCSSPLIPGDPGDRGFVQCKRRWLSAR